MSKVNKWDIQGIAPDSAVTQNQLFDFFDQKGIKIDCLQVDCVGLAISFPVSLSLRIHLSRKIPNKY